MNGTDVRVAAAHCRRVLAPRLAADWSAPVPGLDFTAASVLAHTTQCLLWYAVDLAGGPQDAAAFDVGVRDDAGPEQLLAGLRSAATVCAAVVDTLPDTARGFHPFGTADPDGFAAMACDELLVHGDDAARALGARLEPDRALAGAVLARLFPWHAAGDDPWQTLLWANGRRQLPGRPEQRRWRWHCAPLAEWDGRAPDAE